MDIFDQIATGVRPPPPPSATSATAQPSLQEQLLSYALAKQVPAMERGFSISTSYGDIEVAAEGNDVFYVQAFQRLAKLMLTQKLAHAIAAEKEMGNGC